jgi:hypothetical protein
MLTEELSLKSAIVSSVMLHFVAVFDWASRLSFRGTSPIRRTARQNLARE